VEDRCVMCGAVIPEGRQVCPQCEARVLEQASVDERNKEEGDR